MNPLLTEWKHEAVQTRKMLAAVPNDKLNWKPHEKSMTLGHLAMHLASATSVFTPAIFKHDVYAWAGGKQPEPESVQDILHLFDTASAELAKELEHVSPEALGKIWIFGTVEKPYFTMSRAAAVRQFLFSHTIHHSGQLSVYLRLLDVNVPGMYGPSADEKM